MTFQAKDLITRLSCSHYNVKSQKRRDKINKKDMETATDYADKELGWKTKFIGIKSGSAVDRLLMKWTGKPYNLLMSKLSIDKSEKGRILRKEVRSCFNGRFAKWKTDKQDRIQRICPTL